MYVCVCVMYLYVYTNVCMHLCMYVRVRVCMYNFVCIYTYICTEYPRRNVPEFGTEFLKLKCTDITPKSYVQI